MASPLRSRSRLDDRPRRVAAYRAEIRRCLDAIARAAESEDDCPSLWEITARLRSIESFATNADEEPQEFQP